jgi:hypothetical protein
MLCPFEKNLYKDPWVAVGGWGNGQQGFRRMAAGNKPAGIRSLVYGIGKGKAGIEGLSVSKPKQCPKLGLFWPLPCGR